MAARGRKRKSGNREPNGRIIRRDQRDMDTIDRIEGRNLLMSSPEPRLLPDESQVVFEARYQCWKDARAASLSPDFPLSILFAKGIIDREMHDAGMRFGELYVRVFGAPFASGPGWAKMLGEDARAAPSDARDLRAEAQYRKSLDTLDALEDPTLCRQLVHQLAAYLQFDWYVKDIAGRRPFVERHRKRSKVICRALRALSEMDPVAFAEIGDNPLGISDRKEPEPSQWVAWVVGQFE